MDLKTAVPVWWNWTRRFSNRKSPAADFEGYIRQENNKIDIHQKLALKKRVYEAGDWNGFRTAVNAHKAFGNHLIINK